MSRSRLVYSTDLGRVCPDCGRAVAQCVCPKGSARAGAAGQRGSGSDARPRSGGDPADGVVRVQRESKGRKGKTATTIRGLPLPEAGLQDLAGELKRRLGTGGGVRDGLVVIQGDHAETLIGLLRERGYTVKRSGG